MGQNLTACAGGKATRILLYRTICLIETSGWMPISLGLPLFDDPVQWTNLGSNVGKCVYCISDNGKNLLDVGSIH